MMDYGYGMGAGGWIAMIVFWAGLITLVVWLLSEVVHRRDARAREDGPRREDAPVSADDILDRRFAAGEIDEDAYLSMRTTLRSSRTSRTEPR